MDPQGRAARDQKIYIEAKRQGKSDDFIKLAIQQDRAASGQQSGGTANVAGTANVVPQATQQTYNPIQVTPYQPSIKEKLFNFLQGTAPGKLGTALRGAVTGEGLTPEQQKEGIGAGIQTAANIATIGAGPELGILKSVLKNAAIGGVQSGGQALSTGGSNAKTVGKAILKGVAINGATTGVLAGTAAGIKGLLGNAAEKAAGKIISTPAKQLMAGQESIGQGLLERNMLQTPEKALNTLKTYTEGNIAKQGSILEGVADKQVNLQDAIDVLNKLKESKFSTTSQRGVQSVIDDLARNTGGSETVTIAKAQALKQALQKEVGTNGFLADELGSSSRDAKRVLSRSVRGSIEQVVPEIAPVNKELAFANRAGPQLFKQATQQNTMSLPLGNKSLYGHILELLSNPRITAPAAQKAYNVSKTQLNPLLAALLQRGIGQGTNSATSGY